MEDKLISRIRKLLALSESPNENEASAAAAKAQELILEHGIDWSSVAAGSGDPAGTGVDRQMLRGRVDPWRRYLASGVVDAVGGTYVYHNDYRKWTGHFEFFVPKGTGESVAALYQYLERQLELASKIACANRTDRHVNAMRWRNSWLVGAASRVADRLQARANRGTTGTDLIPFKSAADRAVEEAFDKIIKGNYDPCADVGGYMAGDRAGGRIPLGDAELGGALELEARHGGLL